MKSTRVHKGACLKFSQLKIQVKSTSDITDPDFSEAFIFIQEQACGHDGLWGKFPVQMVNLPICPSIVKKCQKGDRGWCRRLFPETNVGCFKIMKLLRRFLSELTEPDSILIKMIICQEEVTLETALAPLSFLSNLRVTKFIFQTNLGLLDYLYWQVGLSSSEPIFASCTVATPSPMTHNWSLCPVAPSHGSASHLALSPHLGMWFPKKTRGGIVPHGSSWDTSNCSTNTWLNIFFHPVIMMHSSVILNLFTMSL